MASTIFNEIQLFKLQIWPQSALPLKGVPNLKSQHLLEFEGCERLFESHLQVNVCTVHLSFFEIIVTPQNKLEHHMKLLTIGDHHPKHEQILTFQIWHPSKVKLTGARFEA